jgi:hypothetical protein
MKKLIFTVYTQSVLSETSLDSILVQGKQLMLPQEHYLSSFL